MYAKERGRKTCVKGLSGIPNAKFHQNHSCGMKASLLGVILCSLNEGFEFKEKKDTKMKGYSEPYLFGILQWELVILTECLLHMPNLIRQNTVRKENGFKMIIL